ncbi:putative RNA-directed DNA polymerase [Helianthus anomalus]
MTRNHSRPSRPDQPFLQDLRRRKLEVRDQLHHGGNLQANSWNTVISKKAALQEKRFHNRLEMLRNTTSFYVSNLPVGCTRGKLWDVFRDFDNLEDAFVPKKKDGAGNLFGFIRFSGVQDAGEWVKVLQGRKLDGAVLAVSTARFDRDGSKFSNIPNRSNSSVFSRLGNVSQSINRVAVSNPPRESQGVGMSYRDSLLGVKGYTPGPTKIELPPLVTEARKKWAFRSLIGEVKELAMLDDLSPVVLEAGIEFGMVKYMGGLKVLFIFESSEGAENFLRGKSEFWSHWFSRLYVWDGLPPVYDRVAWISISGVPLALWDRHVFNRIAERCGRVLQKSNADCDSINLSCNFMAVLVSSGKKVSLDFQLKWLEHEFPIWVEESDLEWEPVLVPEIDCSSETPFSPVIKSKVVFADEQEAVEEVERSENLHGECQGTCMGNLQDISPFPEVNSARTPTLIDGLGGAQSNDAPVPHAGDDASRNQGPTSGFSGNWTGLQYVTTRPKFKNKDKKNKKAFCSSPVFRTPDLNAMEDSDPFSLDDIINQHSDIHIPRAEAQAAGETSLKSGDDDRRGVVSDGIPANDAFEKEVEETVKYGEALGINLDNFGNQVRKLVKGDLENTRSPIWVRALKKDTKFSFLAIQETHRSGLDKDFCHKFWGRNQLEMASADAIGRSGGVVSMWDPGVFSAEEILVGPSFVLTSGIIQGIQEIVNILNVYAPNDPAMRRNFWSEIISLKCQRPGVWVALGDFNDVRWPEERVNSRFDLASASCFNEFIDQCGFLEYRMTGGSFTYISDNEDIKLSKLDRILVCEGFMSRWPFASLVVLRKGASDHCPVTLSCVDYDFGPCPFRFFNSWIGQAKLDRIVADNVSKLAGWGRRDISFATLLKDIKLDIKAWRRDIRVFEAKHLDELNKAAEALERKAAVDNLSSEEKQLRVNIRLSIRNIEIAKAKDLQQKARLNWIKLGDENSSFFHGIVKVNMARSRINGLKVGDDWITDPSAIKDHVRRAFRKHFAEPMRRRPSFANLGLPLLPPDQASSIIAPFSLDEIRDAIKTCDGGKAPGPDGFSIRFFKHYWEEFKVLVREVFEEFHRTGTISIGCNASFVALIPKIEDPQELGDYRPISLVSSTYKIIAKVLSIRLKRVMDGLISQTQTAFSGGRGIMDGPLIVSEMVSWAKKCKKRMMIFKIDFAKAYDSLNWKFLLKALEYMAFPAKWINWVNGCLSSSKGSVLVNGSPSAEFCFKRGLRQGDPLSPFLFILAMEVLSMFMHQAVAVGLFQGIKLPNDGPLISHLCYADDVLFIGEWSVHNIVSLARFLRCLYLVTGLKVNYKKCHLFGVGVEDTEVASMAETLKCGVGKWPFTYLGLPIGANMKRARYWQPVVDKFHKKLSSWKAKHLSFAGRITLAKSVLGSLPAYFLSMFLAPKCVIKKLESLRRDFVWGRSGWRQKIRWVRWDNMVKPKELGGIGIGSISSFNSAMLSKWWWRFRDNPNQLWALVVNSIHMSKGNKRLIPVRQSVTGVWKDIGSLDKHMLKFGISIAGRLKVVVGNGASTRFWKDVWISPVPLMDLFPDLFRLAANKDGSVQSYSFSSNGSGRWGWQWIKNPSSQAEWDQVGAMMGLLNGVSLKSSVDQWVWENDTGENFSVKSIRKEIDSVSFQNTSELGFNWNSWATPKCNLLFWRALSGRVASKIELSKRGLPVHDVLCSRCGLKPETTDHVFADCMFAKSIWWNIFVWLKVPFPQDGSSFRAFVNALQESPGDKTWKKLVMMVAMATTWRVWQARNSKTFEGSFLPIAKSVDMVKEDTFIWLKQRSKLTSLNWDNWLLFDVVNLL